MLVRIVASNAPTRKPQRCSPRLHTAAKQKKRASQKEAIPRYTGSIRSFNEKLRLGKIECDAITGGTVAVAAAELAGFRPGDTISFALSVDPQFGTPMATALEAEDIASLLKLRPDCTAEPWELSLREQRQQQLASVRAAVMRDVQVAVKRGNELQLRLNLDRAREIGIVEAIEGDNGVSLTEAEVVLGRLAAKRMLKAMLSSTKQQQLQVALARATAAGVGQAELEEGEAALKRLLSSQELAAAASRMDPTSLSDAIKEARDAGVAEVAVAEAEQLLGKLSAIDTLAVAVCGSEERSLQAAIDQARGAGVNNNTLEEAERCLQRISAEFSLEAAVRGKDEAALRQALSKARALNIQGRRAEEAAAALSRAVAARELEEAAEEGEEDTFADQEVILLTDGGGTVCHGQNRLQCAVIAALRAGVDNCVALYRGAEAARSQDLDQKLIDAVEKALSQSVGNDAIREATQASDEAALAEALTFAKDCSVEDTVIHEGKAQLATLAARRQLSAARELAGALAATGAAAAEDMAELRAALANARAAGVASNEITSAEEVLTMAAASAAIPAAPPTPVVMETMKQLEEPVEPGESEDECGDLEELEDRKRKAVEEEDFDLALELKQRMERLRRFRNGLPSASGGDVASAMVAWAAELKKVCAKKEAAVEREDYESAKTLRQRELELEQLLKH